MDRCGGAPVLAELVRSGDEKGMMIDSTFGILYSPMEFFLPLWKFANYNLTLEEAPELQFFNIARPRVWAPISVKDCIFRSAGTHVLPSIPVCPCQKSDHL